DGETLPVSELALVRKIFWRNNIVAVAPLHSLRVRWEPGDVVAPLVGTWFDHPLEPDWRTGLPRTPPTLKIDGRWPRERGESEVVLGRRLAERLGRGAGDELRVRLGQRSLDLRVVGVLTSGGEEDEEAFAPLAAVERLADQPGRFTR